MLKNVSSALMSVLILSASGQIKETTTREVSIIVDNDVFTSVSRDQYYSSGIFGVFRHLLDTTKRSNVKIIQSYSINQRMFTPKWVGWTEAEQMDRPYAGQLSVTLGREYYFRSSQYIKSKLELGWMGPGSLTGDIHETWHKWFGLPPPLGWEHQINDSPVINLYATYAKTLDTSEDADISIESNLSLGTVFSHVRQELMVRLGNFRPIQESIQYNGQLGARRPKSGALIKEAYFFYSPGLEYVFYNATIEGNFIGKDTDYTESTNHWVMQHRAGLMLSWRVFDIQLMYYLRTKETPQADPHQYAGIHLNYRF
ncbi:MAG: lipid A deacylase LpxR family protein [Cyclobacteriaceae bacterium]|nr:lipid A deacylase LpxR family protein [Cyclobacteriaceae bacterium HetDA_MAG_MS6]